VKRFELIEGASSKFWEVGVTGCELTVRYGRIGTSGQSKTKCLADSAAAHKEQAKLIKEKVSKGYAAVAVTDEVGCLTLEAPPPVQPVEIVEPVAAPIHWPQGGMQWTDDLRACIPIVRGIYAPAVPDALPLQNKPLCLTAGPQGIAPREIAAMGQCLGLSWTSWSSEQAQAMLQPAQLARADADFWLKLSAHAIFLQLRQQNRVNPQSYTVVNGLAWVTLTGCGLHGLPFMLGVAMNLVRSVSGYPLLGLKLNDVLNGMLKYLRQLIAGSSDVVHDEAIAWLASHGQANAQDRLVRAYLCPHRTDWAQACLSDKAPNRYTFIKECVIPADEAMALLNTCPPGFQVELQVMLLQLQLHDDGACELLAEALRRANDKDSRKQFLDLALRFHSPYLPALLIACFERKEVRAALDKLSAEYPAAVLNVALKQSLAQGSRALQGWALALALREPAAWAAVQPSLAPSERSAFMDLLKQGQSAEASPHQLPPLLRQPPWLGKARAKALPILSLTPPALAERIGWSQPERQQHGAFQIDPWRLQLLSQEADPVGAQLNQLRLTALARTRLHLGQALEEEDVQTEGYYGTSDETYSVLMLPDQLGLLVWNSYPAQHWRVNGETGSAVRAILAKWGEAALPGLVLFAQAHTKEGLTIALDVDSPRLVPLVLHAIRRLSKPKAVAMQWLHRHMDTALQVALPMAFGADQAERDNAQFALRWCCAHGFGAQARAAALGQGPQVVAALQDLIDADPLLALPSAMPKLPSFFVPSLCRRPVLQGSLVSLPASAIEHLGSMLAISKLEEPYAGLEIVRQACTAASLADCVWDLFEAWLQAGAPVKESWAFSALGLLGTDDTVRRLVPRIKAWSLDGTHQRAAKGLDQLAAIGSDVALLYLHAFTKRGKFKGLHARAREKVAFVAAARGLSAEELADRQVPDLDLDAQGRIKLDFGPRQFMILLDSDLRPVVIDDRGMQLSDLPKPNKSDDAVLAEAATERFKLFKKDVRAHASLQVTRLERAMKDGRRWSGADFHVLFQTQVLMRPLAARLVWGVYDAHSQMQGAFRIAEDGTLADHKDSLFDLSEAATVGIADVLKMPQALQTAMSQIFADYGILQPFKQLGREAAALA